MMGQYEYNNFDLLIDPGTGGEYRARVLHSPGGQSAGEVRFRLPFTREMVVGLARQLRPVRDLVPRSGPATAPIATITELGRQLFVTVFTGDIGGCFNRSLHVLDRTSGAVQQGLRIRLYLNDCAELADLPWELLYDPDRRRFLCMSESTPLVRYAAMAEAEHPLAVLGPLRVLVVIVSAESGPGALDVDAEWDRLCSALAGPQARGDIVVERLGQPTLADLNRRLDRDQFHVLHFIGHGGFDAARGEGVLYFVGTGGRPLAVAASELGVVLHDHRSLRLAVINACEGARADPGDLFAGTVQRLAQQRVPAVVGMQFSISDGAAIAFSEGFYEAIAAGRPLDVATAQGRKSILTLPNHEEWATPVLYTRAADTTVFQRQTADTSEGAGDRSDQAFPPKPAEHSGDSGISTIVVDMELTAGIVSCPVCRWPADPPICVHCHWNLGLGQTSEGDSPAALMARLEAARYKLDSMAAAVAANGEAVVLTQLLKLCRGKPWDPPPGHEQRDERNVPVNAALPNPDLVDSLGSLAMGDLVRQLVFVHVGPDALTWRVVRAAGGGALTVERRGSLPWFSIAGGRVPDAATLAFHLAGGIGTSPTITPPALYDLLAGQLPALGQEANTVVAIARPDDRLLVLSELADYLFNNARYATWAPPMVGTDLDAELQRLLRHAPIPYDYGLALLTLGADNIPRPMTRRLFAAGTVAGVEPLAASVEAVVPDGRDREVTLAVVVDQGGPPQSWIPLTMLRAPLPTGRRRVRVLLDGPGRVRVDGLRTTEETRSWADLIAMLPRRTASIEVDVVVAVEICDADEAGRIRLGTASEIVSGLATAEGVRVAFLTFGQHRRVRTRDERNPVRQLDFDTDARGLVASLARAPETVLVANGDDYCAAAEEMLGVTAGLSWRGPARRALITIGRRPPYPSGRGNDAVARCPDGIDWSAQAALLARQGTVLLAVRQPNEWKWSSSTDGELTRRYDAYWAAVGAHGLFDLDRFRLSDLWSPLGLPRLGTLGALPFPLAAGDDD